MSWTTPVRLAVQIERIERGGVLALASLPWLAYGRRCTYGLFLGLRGSTGLTAIKYLESYPGV